MTLDETCHLLRIARSGRTRGGQDLIRSMIIRRLLSRDRRRDGRRARYAVTEDGFDELLRSKYFDVARVKLDAEQVEDDDDIEPGVQLEVTP